VNDAAACVEQASRLGAGVAIASQQLPDGDEMAIILDPEAISAGLLETAVINFLQDVRRSIRPRAATLFPLTTRAERHILVTRMHSAE
jgi:hypothetical protein